MTDTKDYILDYLAKNRTELKQILKPIQIRRDKMFIDSKTEEWQEIDDSYETAIFLQLYDSLAEKIDLPADELYVELSVLNLAEFFEPLN